MCLYGSKNSNTKTKHQNCMINLKVTAKVRFKTANLFKGLITTIYNGQN